MAIEIEKKYRLDPKRAESVVVGLKDFGAEYLGEDDEENTIYSGNGLREKGAILRVRRIGDTALLTFKQRVANSSDIKHQLEEEIELNDADGLGRILEHLGYVRAMVYEKRRRKWQFRSTEVVLDELPFGHFMEIEGSITAIREAELLLDIEDLKTEHRTYPRLTAELGKHRNGIIEARFGDVDEL